MELLLDLLKIIGFLLVGAVIGFFIARKFIMNQLKKNPPINEDMIKMLMSQMGRKPNQKQINQIMKQMEKFNIEIVVVYILVVQETCYYARIN